MTEKLFEIETESLEEAREKAKKQLPKGITLFSEEIIEYGDPKTIKANADTPEEAFSKAQSSIPIDAVVLEKKVLFSPGTKFITVEVFDENLVEHVAQGRWREYQEDRSTYRVKSIKLADKGSKGFLGIGVKPKNYKVEMLRQATVAIIYEPKARIAITKKRYFDEELEDAIKMGEIKKVEALLDSGLDVNATRGKWTPLLSAAHAGQFEIVKLLVNRGANTEVFTDYDTTGVGTGCLTPLMWATINGHLEIVKFLIEQGANVEAKDEDDHTALWHAKKAEIKTALLQASKKG
jgi:hypothetical protein